MTKNDKLYNTIGYSLLFISLGFGLGLLAEQTNSSLGAIGAIFLVGSIAAMIGTAVGGRILGRQRMTQFSDKQHVNQIVK